VTAPRRTTADERVAALAADLRNATPGLLADVRAHLVATRPDMGGFFDDATDEVLAGSMQAMERLAGLTGQVLDGTTLRTRDVPDVQAALFAEIGRVQWRAGAELADLLSTYQAAARLAWRRIAAAVVAGGHDAETLAAVASALFFIVDEMSTASTQGYVEEQSESASSRERLRAELVDLLLAGSPDRPRLHAAATRAGWRLPADVAVVLVGADTEASRRVLDRLGVNALQIRRDGRLGALVPNPGSPGHRERLASALRGLHAVVGVPVPLDAVPSSVVIAATAAALRRAGVLTDDPVFVDEHLDAVIVHRDSALLESLRAQVLRPLDRAPRVSRDRLRETLRCWLRHMGDRQAIAQELHIHPQTVRYRLRVLHELFGDTLDDPRARAKLMLALAWDSSEPPP
jgi:hypothetical protein